MSRQMTTPERHARSLLEELFRGHEALFKELLAKGLIDLRAAERMAIRHRVDALCAEGRGRCEAMEEAAENFCCSYEKVRAAVYAKPTC